MPKSINVKVTTMDAELQFCIQYNTLGKQLFDQIIRTIGLRETWYFGLLYVDRKEHYCWLDLDKKVSSINIRDKQQMEFQFVVKFYPEDVGEELIQEVTIKLFYLQVRESILRSEIFCPPDTALMLASLACQVKFGDFNTNLPQGFVQQERILPMRIKNQYSWTNNQWEEKLIKWYLDNRGMLREEAMLEYLKIAQDLEMYGVTYFEIQNKKNSRLYLGVDALGLNIYKHSDKLTPHVGFPWSEIRNIAFKDKKFIIKSIDKKAPDFIFYVDKLRINKNILSLCAGNHELFVRRRKEDTIEVQQMKAQAKEDRAMKKAEKERLIKETKAREDAELKLNQLTDEYEKQSRASEDTIKTLESYRNSLDMLNFQLEIQQVQKQELERQQNLLIEENKLLEKKQYERSINCSNELPTSPIVESIEDHSDNNSKDNPEDKIDHTAQPIDSSPVIRRVTGFTTTVSLDKSVTAFGQDLTVLENGDHNTIDKRSTFIESTDDSLQARLKNLQDELKKAHKAGTSEELDNIHENNRAQGLDKFKTLRKIRQGNTKRRIDEFESM